jgi:diguanylate cyclase (GGDEF)-like protein
MAAVPASADAGFRAYRLRVIHAVNETAFYAVAALIVGFTFWDRYVDPANADAALGVRLAGAALVLGSGWFQRAMQRVEWSHWIAKFRLLVTAGTVALALALLEQGFLVGLSGLIVAALGAAHSALDRRDVVPLFLPPLALTVAIMYLAGVERFVFVNATFFLVLTFLVALLLASVLEQANRRAYQAEQALLRESRLDALTGVANRRALDEQGHAALALARRHGQPFALLMLDLDHFKTVNDRHGHGLGDQLLQALAAHCRGLMRESDVFGRWGGEEFLALLPDTGAAQATELAERLRASVAATRWRLGEVELQQTVSIGVAGVAGPQVGDIGAMWSRLVGAADAAMYRAKQHGRNRVESDA